MRVLASFVCALVLGQRIAEQCLGNLFVFLNLGFGLFAVCVCMCVCMYVLGQRIAEQGLSNLLVFLDLGCGLFAVCVCVCMYVCMYVYSMTNVCVCTCVCMYVCMYVCVYVQYIYVRNMAVSPTYNMFIRHIQTYIQHMHTIHAYHMRTWGPSPEPGNVLVLFSESAVKVCYLQTCSKFES